MLRACGSTGRHLWGQLSSLPAGGEGHGPQQPSQSSWGHCGVWVDAVQDGLRKSKSLLLTFLSPCSLGARFPAITSEHCCRLETCWWGLLGCHFYRVFPSDCMCFFTSFSLGFVICMSSVNAKYQLRFALNNLTLRLKPSIQAGDALSLHPPALLRV